MELELGFSLLNHSRNKWLAEKGMNPPTAVSTGTTIAGVVFDGGVVLGADTRATEGPIVADKNCEKIHHIADRIYCCGAGTAADTEFTTALISSKLELLKLTTRKEPRVVAAMTMLKQYLYRHQGQIGAALVLGGVDFTGPHLYAIHPHGSTDKLPFTTLGSGSLAAMSIFESRWNQSMGREEAVSLVSDAIEAGILNDLGSGSNIDITVITADGVEKKRAHKTPTAPPKKKHDFFIPRGSTVVIDEKVFEVGSAEMELC
ncbi:MAG: 20S proteasome subunit beta 2, PSMB7/PUP1 [Amphiamblys sp. WSBS2006]|nr:MAG: 20S proteasome subunit beta 2, PSMB7/PUP1 [Amphiamblys sp. WSBS2006]